MGTKGPKGTKEQDERIERIETKKRTSDVNLYFYLSITNKVVWRQRQRQQHRSKELR